MENTENPVVGAFPSTSSYTPDIPQKDIKGMWIFGESEAKRRIVLIERQNGSYGFTLQSYGVRYKHGHRETDFITYVNAVEKKGAAHQAGLREGDVILSINGQNMARVEHKSLVGFIRQSPDNLKMVVVSDERARKVELHMRYVHLQKKLQDKLKELEELNAREKQILAGTFIKSSCSGSTLGGPCLAAAASTVCCFCPPQSQKKDEAHMSNTGLSASTTTAILQPNSEAEEAKLKHVIQQRSKSVKLFDKEKPSSSGSNTSDSHAQYYYDCYRKCQSSRELNSSNTGTINRKDSTIVSPGLSGPSSTSTPHHSHHHHHHLQHQRSNEKTHQLKPKSWDSLVGTGTTRSFGGYGFGFGYGYFPSGKDTTQSGNGSGCTVTVTHPHHHNHHIHSQCTHPQTSYYKSQKHGDATASKVKVVYNYVAPTYHTIIPNSKSNVGDRGRKSSCNILNTPTRRYGAASLQMEDEDSEIGQHRSKTLPSTKGTTSGKSRNSTTKTSFPKLEKTFSDSSLSDHYKEFAKTIGYFQRSGDNVRFSSEEDFEIYPVRVGHGHGESVASGRKSKSAKERERIFV